MPATTKFVSSIAALLVLAAACSDGPIDTIEVPSAGAGGAGGSTGGTGGATGGTGGATGGTGGATGGTGGATGGTGGATGGTGGATGGTGGATGGTGGSDMAGSAGGPPTTGGVGGTAGAGGSAGTEIAMGGSAGTDVMMAGMGGTAGTADPTGGTAGVGPAAGTGGGGGGSGPYAARTGSFKVFAYSKTTGYRHDQAISGGKSMLMGMATKQGFEVTFSENADDFNAQNLMQYEVVFGLDPTGNNVPNNGKAAFEEWMTMKNGGFAGVHSSTDWENGWAFYSEVTGQYYDLHDQCCSQQNIQWDAAATEFIAVKGLPSPWARSEEWYKFNSASSWTAKPGFKVLSRVTTAGGGTRPVSFVREYNNFRSFYTSLGHEGPTYSDANFIKHVAAGIMWAARREALFKP